jgi:hypothetical protein
MGHSGVLAMATGSYYIFPVTGTIQQQASRIAGIALNAAGWAGPFPTIAAAKASLPAGKDVGGLISSGASDVTGGTLGFLKTLTSRELWIRVAEGVLGLLLILVAVAELTKGTAVSSAIKKTPVLFA